MSTLHALLAVESDYRSQADACRTELTGTFKDKGHHFSKKLVTQKFFEADKPDKQIEQLALQTSVKEELKWIGDKIGKVIDSGHQIDVANTRAVADVILDDGTAILSAVPSTSLLRLEHRLVEIRDLIHTIPTLDPSQGFVPDPSQVDGTFKARDIEKPLTDKRFQYIIMQPPTEKFPAQIKEHMVDEKIGTTLTQEWSSLITVKAKGRMLDRVEELIRAVKKARSSANDMNVDSKVSIADDVLSYIFALAA